MKSLDTSGCGCRCLLILLIFILWAIGTIIFWLVNAFAYLGSTFILIGDYAANAFTPIGIQNPPVGWLLLGCLVGGMLGLAEGLKRTGRSSELYKVYLAAIAIVLMLQAVAYSKWQTQFDTNVFQKVILQETFTSPKSWNLHQGATIKDGGLFITQHQANPLSLSSWEGRILADVDFAADVVKVSGSDASYFGIAARVTGDERQSFYYLRINGDGNFAMGKYFGDRWNDIVGPKEIGILNVGNSKNQLRLVCNGNLILGFVNDRMVGIFRDTSYQTGKIAVESAPDEDGAAAVYFDNVVVKEKPK